MRRYLFTLVAACAVLLSMASPAGAVTDGVWDGDAHSYVGLAVFYDAEGTPLHRCSGTLLGPELFLTAGHCTAGTASAQVWFEPEVTSALGYPFSGGVTGTPVTHPDFVWSLPNTSDLGLIYLDKRVKRSTYGVVADLGTLDAMATERGRQETWFTVVGYGLQEILPTYMDDKVRLQAAVQLVNLKSALTDGYNIQHTNAPGTGGGTCFGDSGGPVFLNDTNIVVAVTSFGLNENCVGAGFAYRTDIPTAHGFIYG